ncbi:MAG TPA: hypothetical protein VFS00_14640, partial [Polyangiaceae bacterium]|nr:hypothetical protein [Polyangiaceae bacterium]
MLLASGCSLFFDDSALREGDDDDDGGQGGAAGTGGKGGSGGTGGQGGDGGSSVGGGGGVGGTGGGVAGNDGGGSSGAGGMVPGLLYDRVILDDDPIAYYRFDDADEASAPSLVDGAPDLNFEGFVDLTEPGAISLPGG